VSGTHKLLRFGVFELNLDTEELRKSGTLIKLPPQPLRLLTLLATHAGQVVTREDIKEQLWGEETYVDFEQGMNHCVKQIRTALSDNADNPLYVETLPRRGYRFLPPVVSKNIPAPAPKIIKSQSGIQSDVLPALTRNGTREAQKVGDRQSAVEVVADKNSPATDASAVSKSERAPTTDAVPVCSTEVVAREENPARREKVTSATAAAEALAPEIARLRKSPSQARRRMVWIAISLVFLIAALLYWYLHLP
jgi:DNA-binding winged helix-turn-helix (wHTH) protein